LILRRPPNSTPFPYTTLFRSHPNDSMSLRVQRGDKAFDVTVKPVPMAVEGEKKPRPRIGIGWDTRLTISHPSPVELVHNSVTSTDRKSTRLNSSHSQISYAVF